MGFKNLNNQLKENKTADEFVNSARGETEEAVTKKFKKLLEESNLLK